MKNRADIKIGILTFHREGNVGANLQAYALCAYLNGIYNQTELVDFYPNAHKRTISFKRKIYNLAKLILFPRTRKYVRLSHKYNEFQNNNYKLSQEKYYGDIDIKEHLAKYDVLISGSDQILNLTLSNNTFAYYLPFDNVKKISYASSFGRSNITDIEKWAILNYLPSFDKLSFREENGFEIADSLIGIKDKNIVVDPTFLLDKKDWETFIVKNKKQNKKYILVYNMEKSTWFENTIDYAAKMHPDYRVIIVNGCSSELNLKCRYKKYGKAAPQDFLNLMYNADIVITNSFHGIAFSLIFQKKFYACSHSKRNARLEYILSLINNSDKLINESSTSYAFIDGKDAYFKLNDSIEKSKTFLLQSIDELL